MTHILDEVENALSQFVAYPSDEARVAHTLWTAHTHLMDVWESTPRIAFLSPEPGSGKTRALEITETLVPRPVVAVNVTPAYLFRKVGDEDGAPTILFDEIDTVFGPKARENEEIRGLLNAGHRRGATAGRCIVRGKTVLTEEIPAYSAVALAGIGDLPDTIISRSIVIRMRRRAPGEQVTPFRRRVHGPDLDMLGIRLSEWCEDHAGQVTWPEMPEGVEDRDADIWEPLLAVADLAGGEWPARARVSCVSLVSLSKASTPSLGVRLLDDLRNIFGDQHAMSSEAIVDALCSIEEAPWADLYGKTLNKRGLAQRLRKFEVSSKQIRFGEATLKGYSREDLEDVWQRYLTAESPKETLAKASSHSIPLEEENQAQGPSTYGNETSETTETGDLFAPCPECGLSDGRHGSVCSRLPDPL